MKKMFKCLFFWLAIVCLAAFIAVCVLGSAVNRKDKFAKKFVHALEKQSEKEYINLFRPEEREDAKIDLEYSGGLPQITGEMTNVEFYYSDAYTDEEGVTSVSILLGKQGSMNKSYISDMLISYETIDKKSYLVY